MSEAVGPKSDYYEVLGVQPDADWRAIDAAYYRRADELKTALGGDKPAFASAFAHLNEAYSTLNDGQRRAVYDRTFSARRLESASSSQAARSRFGWLHHRHH